MHEQKTLPTNKEKRYYQLIDQYQLPIGNGEKEILEKKFNTLLEADVNENYYVDKIKGDFIKAKNNTQK